MQTQTLELRKVSHFIINILLPYFPKIKINTKHPFYLPYLLPLTTNASPLWYIYTIVHLQAQSHKRKPVCIKTVLLACFHIFKHLNCTSFHTLSQLKTPSTSFHFAYFSAGMHAVYASVLLCEHQHTYSIFIYSSILDTSHICTHTYLHYRTIEK